METRYVSVANFKEVESLLKSVSLFINIGGFTIDLCLGGISFDSFRNFLVMLN